MRNKPLLMSHPIGLGVTVGKGIPCPPAPRSQGASPHRQRQAEAGYKSGDSQYLHQGSPETARLGFWASRPGRLSVWMTSLGLLRLGPETCGSAFHGGLSSPCPVRDGDRTALAHRPCSCQSQRIGCWLSPVMLACRPTPATLALQGNRFTVMSLGSPVVFEAKVPFSSPIPRCQG